MKLLPSRASVIVLVAAGATGGLALLLGAALPRVVAVGTVLAALMLAWGAVDLALSVMAWRRAPLELQRRLPAALAVGVQRALQLQLRNTGHRAWRVALFDHVDPSMSTEGLPLALRLPAQREAELAYRVTPHRRGLVRFAPAEARVRTLGGSFELVLRLGAEQTLRVYPNFAAVSRYAWLAGDKRLAEIGIKTYTQRGAGTDFKQLTDYTPGDSVRHIDWRATLRHRRPIVREFQDERDQRVLFVLDCGRRMRADEGVQASHFDEALNALMLLAYVALKEGDEVGAFTFGSDDARHIAPHKGAGTLNALITRLYDIEPQPSHSDYLRMAEDVMRLQPKRSLVIVLTNFRDEDGAELEPALKLLRSRHLVMLASLRERALRELAQQPLRTPQQAVDVAGSHLFAQARHEAFKRLAGRDGLLIDVEPAQLATELVNHYHAVKRAGVL